MITLSSFEDSSIASGIYQHWTQWNSDRNKAMELWAEIDKYLLATDTSMLEGGDNFDHKTHLPILSELHEDLLAIVYSTMFPHDDWLGWKGFDINSITKVLREKVLSFVKQAHSKNGFSIEMRKIIDDFIRYGNCFGQAYHKTGDYSGPAIRRISPLDIVFNPTATNFEEAPKIHKTLMDLGSFVELATATSNEDTTLTPADLEKLIQRRTGAKDDITNAKKNAQYVSQGFNSIESYLRSGVVEILWFYGDVFCADTYEIHKSQCIAIVDGDTVFVKKGNVKPNIFKGGWTNRPDNLWSQGPLDKVVGINYMINHRENGKNDAIDKFIYPDRAYVGDVEEIYDEVTGHTKYIMPEGGSVTDIAPDSTVLSFDNQIMMHRELARTSARLPQQLAGFRTPGEKTATEVQSLNDGAFRGFINKVAQLEEVLLMPLIAREIRVAKDNYSSVIRILRESDNNLLMPDEITEEDLSANATLVPQGSSRFARQLQQLQGLIQLGNTNIAQMVAPHISSYKLAKTVEALYGFDRYDFINKFASIDEQVEAQQKQTMAQQVAIKQASQPTAAEMELDEDLEDYDE